MRCHAGEHILMCSWRDLYFSCKAIEETGCLFKNNTFNVVILFKVYFLKKKYSEHLFAWIYIGYSVY